jgi:hypothetical protein
MDDRLFTCEGMRRLTALRDPIVDTIRGRGYAVVRGLFEENKIAESLEAIYRYLHSNSHEASSGLSPMDVRRNMSKWSIRGPQDGPARFALVIYNPLFDSDLFQLHDAFDRIIRIRDTIAGREILRDVELLPDRFNACRIQIYPAGGGFIAEHRDAKGESNLPVGPYIEVLLLLTQRGIDYRTGGAFVRFKGVELDSEAGTKRGDLLIYDASTIHGVLGVDLDVPFDASNLRGRAVAVASVYGNQ